MLAVTDEIVEAFLGEFESPRHQVGVEHRARAALEAILPLLATSATAKAAALDMDTMVDQLCNDHYSVWIEPATP